jgi:hypothetical protein
LLVLLKLLLRAALNAFNDSDGMPGVFCKANIVLACLVETSNR